jgi:hypothetical protein
VPHETLLTEGRILWSTKEVAALAEVKVQAIRYAVAEGRIEPVVRGRGQGKQHYFSTQQVIGLSAEEAITGSIRGCDPGFGNQVISVFTCLSDAGLAHWLQLRSDDHSEEGFAMWSHRLKKLPKIEAPEVEVPEGSPGFEVDPDLLEDLGRKTEAEIDRRIDKVRNALKQRLQEASSRLSGRA